ncbi:HNH endonuclease [Dermacoccus sp. Tok2021]|uniref:HNH endonuclease n=1 Tax=Dermacoccus sp. Tok2021 TaxID=2826873 RepID=UPI001CA65580
MTDLNHGDPVSGFHTVASVTRHPLTRGKSQSGRLSTPDLIEFVDGRRIERVHQQVEVELHSLPPIRPGTFDLCPICLTPGTGTREDVPPRALGGSVLTNTCSQCNNDLGSKVDSHLVMWMNDEMTAWLEVDGVRGRRKVGTVAVRRSGEDCALVPDRDAPPEVIDQMRAGNIPQLTYQLPDTRRVRLAILKSTYLACCVATESILDTPSARIMREDLMAARSLKRDDVPDVRTSLAFYRGNGERNDVRTRLCVDRDGTFWVSLAGVLLVKWPFPELHPALVPDTSA